MFYNSRVVVVVVVVVVVIVVVVVVVVAVVAVVVINTAEICKGYLYYMSLRMVVYCVCQQY